MGTIARLLVLIACGAVSVASFGPGDDPPEPDSCNDPAAGTVTSIEVGERGESVFVPMQDGSVVDFIRGGQGSPMLPVRYRIVGPDLPACAQHRTTIRYCAVWDSPDCVEETTTNLVTALKTYEEDDGSRSTKTLFVIMSEPANRMPLQVEVQIGDAIVNRTFYIGEVPAPDAFVPPDTSTVDAAPVSDAAQTDAALDAN